MNILRLYVPLLFGYGYSTNIGFAGLGTSVRMRSIFVKNIDTQKPYVSSFGTRSYFQIGLDKETIKKLKKWHLVTISKLYSKETYELNDFEKRLRIAINFFSKGITNINPIDKFLSYVISMESLIGFRKAGFSEHFSLILNKIFVKKKSSLEFKRKSFSYFKSIYDLRSSVVHSGTDYIYPGLLKKTERFSFQLIFFMLRYSNKISNNNELSQFLSDLKIK